MITYLWIGPRCTTCFFHFNIDYRLGLTDVQDRIIREPYYKLLQLYDRHPNWAFTVECQAEMMKQIFNNSQYQEIKDLTLKLLERNQLELQCALQFSELFYAYPADVFELNLNHANKTLDSLGILNDVSNCILFQEGQFAYGLVALLNSPYAGNINTVLVSHQQIKDFKPPHKESRDFPVYILENQQKSNSIKLLQYDYFPKWEADYFHSWNYLFDGELAFEAEESEEEFIVSDEKIKAYEEEMILLEKQGNEFLTCSEWVDHCERVNAVGSIDYYLPESNWNTAEYNSSFLWMGHNGDSTDDGELLANNYRCRQIILATRILYEKYKSQLSSLIQTLIESKFLNAERLWLQATCSDSTGVGPDPIERFTAEQNVLIAQQNCSQIINTISENVNEVNTSLLQVDLLTKKIFNEPHKFQALVSLIDENFPIEDLPIHLTIDSQREGHNNPQTNVTVSKVLYNASNEESESETFELYKIDVIFEGSHDWNDDSVQLISIKFNFDRQSFQEILYSPSLLENETVRMYRNQYPTAPVYIFLPLSNGMLFIPNQG